MEKEELKEKVLKHSEDKNLEKANEYIDEFIAHPDTSQDEIDKLVAKALVKVRDADK